MYSVFVLVMWVMLWRLVWWGCVGVGCSLARGGWTKELVVKVVVVNGSLYVV